MATSPSATPTPITPPRVPLINERTGLIDRAWYMFFLGIFQSAQTVDTAFDPDSSAALATYDAALRTLQQSVESAPPTATAETQAQAQALAQSVQAQPPVTLEQLTELAKQVDALALAPVFTPQLHRRAYGSFYDTTTQAAAVINTAYAMAFNTTDLSNGVYRGTPTSRIYVDRPGVYNLQFSAQLDNTSGTDNFIYIWLRVNGSDVANSAGETRLKGLSGQLVAAWNYIYSFNAGDYFELMWSTDNLNVQILAKAAVAPVPGIPSVILTVTDNISAYQD